MPNMISLRSFRLASLTGHVVQFEAKKPTFVPDAAVSEAMAAGCVPENESDIPFYEDVDRAKVEFTGDVRKSMLYLAAQAVAKRNNPKDFDGGGTPKTQVVADMLGYEVSREELLSVYQQYLQVQQENLDYALHPNAANIMRVIEAGSKAELLELASEFGVPDDKAKGLSVKDLRKLLLVKFSGHAA